MTETEHKVLTAEFALARHASQFVDHLTVGNDHAKGGPAAWNYVPGTLKREGKTVTWEWSGDPEDRKAYFQYLIDMGETVGYFGSAPQGRKAKLNGRAQW